MGWGEEGLVENRFTNIYWTLDIKVWHMLYSVVSFKIINRGPLILHKIKDDGMPVFNGGGIQSYNLIPFIACAHIFSTSKST